MPGQLAGTLSIPADQARHAASWFSLRNFVVILIIVAVIIILLAGPVAAGALYEVLSRGAERAMAGTFFTGLGVLFIGIIAGVEIIIFIGLGLVGAVILGWIIDNYLARIAAVFRGVPHHGHRACPAQDVQLIAREDGPAYGVELLRAGWNTKGPSRFWVVLSVRRSGR